MTDFDADEKVLPIRAKPPATTYLADNILGVVGVVLALGAALFPWYILVHQDRFGTPTTGDGVAVRDLGNLPRNGGWSTTPRAVADSDSTTGLPATVDSLTTATVPSASNKGNPSNSDDENQPFPSGKAFKLLHVANGMAMIEDRTGIYIVKVGAVLPDNSTLATLDERDGKPVLITSNGDVVAAE